MGNLVSEDVGKRREDAGGGEGKERLGAKTGPTYDEWGAGMEYRIFPQTRPWRTDGTSIFFRVRHMSARFATSRHGPFFLSKEDSSEKRKLYF